MSDDLVQRLRSRAWCPCGVCQDSAKAADALERLQADNINAGEVVHENEWLRSEVVRLQQALRDVLDIFSDLHDDCDCATCLYEKSTLAAARAVLNGDQQ